AAVLHVSTNHPAEAREAYLRADEQYRLALPNDGGADTLNAYAWHLADCPVADVRDPVRAADLARRAIDRAPHEGRIWNTLGVAYSRAGEWHSAIAALDRSMELRSGGNPWDWFFLAMAHRQLGDRQAANEWYEKAARWMDTAGPPSMELLRYRAEAALLLGRPPDRLTSAGAGTRQQASPPPPRTNENSRQPNPPRTLRAGFRPPARRESARPCAHCPMVLSRPPTRNDHVADPSAELAPNSHQPPPDPASRRGT